MPKYNVTILKNVQPGKITPGPLQEQVQVDARDDSAARGLVQAQYGNSYKVVGCFQVR